MGHHSNWAVCMINTFRVGKVPFSRDFLSLMSYFQYVPPFLFTQGLIYCLLSVS